MINTKCPQCGNDAMSAKRKLIPIFVAYCKSCGAELNLSKNVGTKTWIITILCMAVFYFTKNGDYHYIGWLFIFIAYLSWQAMAPLNLLNQGNKN